MGCLRLWNSLFYASYTQSQYSIDWGKNIKPEKLPVAFEVYLISPVLYLYKGSKTTILVCLRGLVLIRANCVRVAVLQSPLSR